MSNRTERNAITELALREWRDYDSILRSRGETWENTDFRTWGPGMQIVSGRITVLLQVARTLGFHLDHGTLAHLHAERQEAARARRTDLAGV